MSTKINIRHRNEAMLAAHVIMILGFLAIIAAAPANLPTIGAVGVVLMAISVPVYFHAMKEDLRY